MMTFKQLLTFNLRHRLWVLLFFAALTTASAFALPYLKFDFSPEAMLEFSDEELEYQEDFNRRFSSNDSRFLIVLHSTAQTFYESEALTALGMLTKKASNCDSVENAYSLAVLPDNNVSGSVLLSGKAAPIISALPVSPEDAEAMKKRIENSHMMKGNLISRDGHYALLILTLKENFVDPEKFFPVLDTIREEFPDIIKETVKNPEEYTLHYGGLPYIRALTVERMKIEQLQLWPIVGALYFLALLVLFRSFWQALIPLLSIGFVVLWSIAVLVLSGQAVTMINNTLPLLILVIGVTNGIYVLTRILDEKRKDKDKNIAVRDGTYRVALATLLTTSTTAIGFASLATAHSPILRSFGMIIALSVMFIYVAIIFMMPQIVSLLPLKPRKIDESKIDRFIENFAEKWGRFSVRFALPVLIASLVFFALCLAAGTRVALDSKVNDVFEEGHPVSVTNRLIEDELGGILPLEIDLKGPDGTFKTPETLKRLSELQDRVSLVPGVLSAISLRDIMMEAGLDFENTPSPLATRVAFNAIYKIQPEEIDAFMTRDAANAHISVRLPDSGVKNSKQTIALIKKLCAEFEIQNPGVTTRLTGIAYLSTMGLDTFLKDLVYSLLTAFVIIFFVLFAVYKNIWAGLASLLPNVLPLVITLAMMLVYDFELNTTSVLVFTISIGLAVDNSIHIISRFRQEFRFGTSVEDAIIRAMKSSGRAILQSNLLLISGLAILLVSSFEPISRVGILTMTTIAAALFVAQMLLPAELKYLGKKMPLKEYPKYRQSNTSGLDTNFSRSTAQHTESIDNKQSKIASESTIRVAAKKAVSSNTMNSSTQYKMVKRPKK